MEFKKPGSAEVQTKAISSSGLTTKCWSIQFYGLPYCRKCDYLATDDCGGYRIRREILKGDYLKDGLPDVGGMYEKKDNQE
jgi:hypothetical protein